MYYLGTHIHLVKQFKIHKKTVSIEFNIVVTSWWEQERAQKMQKSCW